MGWAIKRPDGSWRAWNRNAQEDHLQDGEVWVAMDEPPIISAAAAPIPLPRAFRSALLGQLDGVDRESKLARAQDLRERFPGLTEPFLTALAGPNLSQDEADIILRLWARIKARAGTVFEVLSAAEISQIEALAPTYRIRIL